MPISSSFAKRWTYSFGISDMINAVPAAGGFYYHFDIQYCLEQLCENDVMSIVDGLHVSIQMNIDGLPLF